MGLTKQKSEYTSLYICTVIVIKNFENITKIKNIKVSYFKNIKIQRIIFNRTTLNALIT